MERRTHDHNPDGRASIIDVVDEAVDSINTLIDGNRHLTHAYDTELRVVNTARSSGDR